MKYATWTISQPEGSTPESLIRSRGGQASGGMMLDENTVLGYLSDDATITDSSEWNLTVKTEQEALALAQAINPECFLTADGQISSPLLDRF